MQRRLRGIVDRRALLCGAVRETWGGEQMVSGGRQWASLRVTVRLYRATERIQRSSQLDLETLDRPVESGEMLECRYVRRVRNSALRCSQDLKNNCLHLITPTPNSTTYACGAKVRSTHYGVLYTARPSAEAEREPMINVLETRQARIWTRAACLRPRRAPLVCHPSPDASVMILWARTSSRETARNGASQPRDVYRRRRLRRRTGAPETDGILHNRAREPRTCTYCTTPVQLRW